LREQPKERDGVMSVWAKRGVWVALGVAIGFGASTLVPMQPINAVATSGGFEGTMIATGRSQLATADLLWMLDDRGMLSCHLMGPQGRVSSAAPIDVKQAIKGKGGKKGKYAMVTGHFTEQGSIADVLYVTESTSSTVGVFALVNDGIRLINTLGVRRE
jgi:hypothetical protein